MSTDGHHEEKGFIRTYIFSIDHKTVGKQYLGIGLFWALMGGLLAYFFRWHLSNPGEPVPLLGPALAWVQTVLNGSIYPAFGLDWQMQIVNESGAVVQSAYNMLITMHGTIMIFFVAMPILLGAFGNFLVPLMIGADDMAFPRLNMMSVWTLALASVVLLSSFFVQNGAANAGWTSYVPLAADPGYSGGNLWGQNLWLIAVGLEFTSFFMGGVNLLTTTAKMRAPGMSWFRLPMMVWTQVIAAVLFLLSAGPLLAGCIMLFLDRMLGTGFFDPGQGGDPLLWQHLFWFFGHPEVYVAMLPGIGVLLEVFPVFSRKSLFGYRPIVYMASAAGILSFLVWAHHQFVSGMDPELASPFMITTILISDPFALIVFASIVTLWGGTIEFKTPMLFALGTLLVFIIGGVTGIFLASTPVDIVLHDTQFVVAHFHYTLFSSVIFGGFGGIYFWAPKLFGSKMNEFWGKVHFFATFIGFNGVFTPLFMAGLGGHPRRISDPGNYTFLDPVETYNTGATMAAIFLLLGQIPFVINLIYARFFAEKAEENPWDANTLEWQTANPIPHGNFEEVPTVYRGPYEYSSPKSDKHYLPQNLALDTES